MGRLGKKIYVGVSPRTNVAGIKELQHILKPYGYETIPVSLRGCLHLKTGCTALDEDTIIINPEWVDCAPFQKYKLINTLPEEPFGANILPIHNTICMNAAFPKTELLVKSLGYHVASTDISEFAKAEAGLTCMCIPFYL